MLRHSLFFSFLLALCAHAQQEPDKELTPDPAEAKAAAEAEAKARKEAAALEAVLKEVAKIHREAALRHGPIGFAILPVVDSNPSALRGYHEDLALLPASTLKVVTTATALELLGSEFAFETTLQHTGAIDEMGTLKGDLVLKGGGDPTLGSKDIARTHALWSNALKEAGIKKIEGQVIGDDLLFGTQMRADSWQWNDLGNYYAAGASGLNFHRNQFYCRFHTGKVGTQARLAGTDPRLHKVTFVNEMKVGQPGTGDQGYVYGAPFSNLLYLRGTLPPEQNNFTIRGSLPDPAYFCARSLSLYLVKNKIEISGEANTARRLAIDKKAIGKVHDLMVQKSAPLSKLIATTNYRSDNLHAECLHRILGVKKGMSGSTPEASKVIAKYWKSRGLDLNGFHMADGCGLSRMNTITARQLTLILYHTAQSKSFETFYKSLPVAGRSGTLRHIGRGSACEGRVNAKSGSIERVKTYCGYLDAKSGKRYAFTILVNNYTGSVSQVKDRIVRVWNKMIVL